MSFSVSYSSNMVCITPPPRFDAILSEKSGRGFSRFYFRGIKTCAEERDMPPYFYAIEFTDQNNIAE